jgi:hypothetical protein
LFNFQQQLIIINESLKSLTDSQNVMQETLYDYVTQDPEVFEDYVSGIHLKYSLILVLLKKFMQMINELINYK